MFISLWTTRIILNALGEDNFGIYSVIGGAIALLGFLNAAMASSTQRFLNVGEGENDITKQKITFNSAIVVHLILGILFAVILLVAFLFFFNGILDIPKDRIFAAKIVYASMAVSTAFTIISVPYDACVNAHENMKFYAIIGIVEVILKLIIAYTLYLTEYDRLIIYAIIMAFIPIITLSLMRIYCHKHYPECIINLKLYFDKQKSRELVSFAGWNLANTFSSMGTQYGLNIVINHYFGVLLNAAQGIANQVSGVLFALSQNALKALNPIIFKSQNDSNDKLIYYSLLGCKMSYAIFAFFAIPLTIYMSDVLRLWLNQVPVWASIFCQLQLIRLLTELLTLTFNTSILANGDVKYFNIAKSINNIVPLIVVPLLFSYGYKPYWLYLVWIISWSIIGGIINLYYAIHLNNLKIRAYIRDVLYPSAIITIIPSSVLIALKYCDASYAIWLSFAIYPLIYFYVGYYVVLKTNERAIVRNFIRLKAH